MPKRVPIKQKTNSMYLRKFIIKYKHPERYKRLFKR